MFVTSEVPESYTHMREQRLRWFRSTYHVSARCRELLSSKTFTLRGKIILPYMLLNSSRRAMMIPLILYGIIDYIIQFNDFNTIAWQSIAAVIVGAPTLVAIFCALINNSVKVLLYIPHYLIFRVLRAYFTLESLLTISIHAPSTNSAIKTPPSNSCFIGN